MTLNQSIEEAKLLKDIVKNVYSAIYTMPHFKESEVELRAETLRGFVLILQSDIYEMLKQWELEGKEASRGEG